MNTRPSRPSSPSCYKNIDHGFTLVEIIISLLILGTSFVTILGLQSSITRRALQDENRMQTMLVARRILAKLEADDFLLTVGQREDKITAFFDEEEIDDTLTNEMRASLNIEYWGIPDNPNALKRVTLSVYWDEFPDDGVKLFYFAPNTDGAEKPSADAAEEGEEGAEGEEG